MAREPGVLTRANNLVGSTLESAEQVTVNTLETIEDATKLLKVSLEDSLIDAEASIYETKALLLDAKVAYAKKKITIAEELKALGMSQEEINQFLQD